MKAKEKPAVIRVRPMTLSDHAAALALWQACEGVGLTKADEKPPIASFLKRNPGLSFVARAQRQLVGAVLCGHDGRRGFLYHLAVAKEHRLHGIGSKLVEKALAALRKKGIERCHIVVYTHNTEGQKFWLKSGWLRRDNLLIMSKQLTT